MEIVIFCLALACLILIIVAFLADRGRRAEIQAHAKTVDALRDWGIVERQLWYRKGYQQAVEDRNE